MSRLPRPASIRARYTMMAMTLALVAVVSAGASLDAVARYKTEVDTFSENERVASQWSAAVRAGHLPRVIPASGGVDLVQLVDANGAVIRASRHAPVNRPLTTVRPPADDRFRNVTECPGPGEPCVMIMAIRVSPAADSSVVYAGTRQPDLLATHHLEIIIVGGGLLAIVLTAWITWAMVGRTLRPVQAIRTRMSEISVTDLSLRVPIPPGKDEIAMLARSANQTLERLDAAVRQQRQFASDTSHELRTPIAGLRVRLEEALLSPDDVDPLDAIRGALTTVDRMEAIVGDLLVLARLRADGQQPPVVVDLGALAKEVASSRIDGVPVRLHATEDVPVLCSRIQIIRVLENLLNNAQRHAESAVDVTVEAAGDEAVVTVSDDGAGIAPQDRERVFDRFVRLSDGRRRDPGGSGLGLSICREIAHAHGGTLTVEDSPRGARFVLRLPFSRVAGEALSEYREDSRPRTQVDS
ncbi:HAMP domain-containing sensor histidine kinase [Sphaerisporangium sp. TRM90804]|uniref:sensor histidine kinase n=1 Tax=Sphaerisporangium sp. TRM90804 TaxID=3031113 RepID=UPI002448D972|nr:HAMP domain-containing sensor histidine kinase [Sphaerisporangium sp. TRM90804]MDH2427343.1 HAMP domain-containing sensor histidine kinase [Sphaerisporangium sp. TRM90804]